MAGVRWAVPVPPRGRSWCTCGCHQRISASAWTGRSTEVGSALDGRRGEFLALLGDGSVRAIVAEHRGRFARFGAGYVEAALSAQGRRLLVADHSGPDDDLVGDVTEVLTSLCTRRYGRRAAADRVRRAVEAAAGSAP